MWMCWGLQNKGEEFILDFPTYLDKYINEGLVVVKEGKRVPFKWYSLLMHLNLSHCQLYFAQGIDFETEKDGMKLPVQLWTMILSSNWEGSNLVLFENDLAYMLRKRLIHQV